MKTAEQWRNEIQSAMGDHLSLAQEARLLERSAAAIQADALRHAAGIVNDARGECLDLRDVRDFIKAEAAELEEAK